MKRCSIVLFSQCQMSNLLVNCANTDGPLFDASGYDLLNAFACSRIHTRIFSRLPAAIKLELDECSLTSDEPPAVPLLPLVLLDPSLPNACECDEPCRPQRAGFSDAKNDEVFELEPKRDRDEPDELLPPAAADDEPPEDDDGVLRPDEPSAVALLINSCITDDEWSS